MKKSRIIALSLLLAVVVGVGVFNYVMHGGARDLSQEETDFAVTSKTLAEEFTNNTTVANSKYLEKAVAVKGIVTAANANEITLDNGIICTLMKSDKAIKVNQPITIKGRVVGYDDLMGEIKLDQCFSI
jgi:hypothetical protein